MGNGAAMSINPDNTQKRNLSRLYAILSVFILAFCLILLVTTLSILFTFAFWPYFPASSPSGVWRAVYATIVGFAVTILGVTVSKQLRGCFDRFIHRLRIPRRLVPFCIISVLLSGVAGYSIFVLTSTDEIPELIAAYDQACSYAHSHIPSILKKEGLDKGHNVALHKSFLRSITMRQRCEPLSIDDETSLNRSAGTMNRIVERVIAHVGMAQISANAGDVRNMVDHLKEAESLAYLMQWRNDEPLQFVLQEQLVTSLHFAAQPWPAADREVAIRMWRDGSRKLRGAYPESASIALRIQLFEAAEQILRGNYLIACRMTTHLIEEIELAVENEIVTESVGDSLRGDALNNRGLTRLLLGQYREAVTDLKEAREIQAGDIRITDLNILFTLSQIGDQEAAEKLIAQLERDPIVPEEYAIFAIATGDDAQRAAYISHLVGRSVSETGNLTDAEKRELSQRCQFVFRGLPIQPSHFEFDFASSQE